jgi:hypothetical protein
MIYLNSCNSFTKSRLGCLVQRQDAHQQENPGPRGARPRGSPWAGPLGQSGHPVTDRERPVFESQSVQFLFPLSVFGILDLSSADERTGVCRTKVDQTSAPPHKPPTSPTIFFFFSNSHPPSLFPNATVHVPKPAQTSHQRTLGPVARRSPTAWSTGT